MKRAVAAGRLRGAVGTWELPRDPASPALGRQFAADAIAKWGLDPEGDCAANLQLCVSEAVTNAVTHGEGTVLLTVTRKTHAIVCRVRDDGRWQPPPTRTGDSEHGRGLKLIIALAETYEITGADGGTTVMFSIPIAPGPVSAVAA